MSDSPWQSPSGATPPPPPPAFGVAPPPPPGAVQPPPPPGGAVPQPPPVVSTYGAQVPPPPGWTPPPKPGLIPLQPMTLGTILGASFRVLRRNPRPTFGVALLIEAITIVLSAGVLGLVFVFAFSRVENATSSDSADTIGNGSVALLLLAYLVPITLAVFGLALTQGLFAMEVARGTIGEKLTLRGLWRQSKGRMWPLIGWLWAVVGAALVVYIIFVVVIVVAAASGSAVGVAVAIIVGILGGLGAIALVAWLYAKLSLVPAALMVERLTLRAAIVRSWTLTRGYFWRTLGIELLVGVIINVAASVVTAPLEIVFLFISGLFNQTGDHTTEIVIAVILGVVTVALTVVVGAVASVVQASTTALIYIDLRMRKEALDLQLIQFVEARQVGDDSATDPYASPAQGAAAQTPPPAFAAPPA